MKRQIFRTVIFGTMMFHFFACSSLKEPEFRGVEHLKLKAIGQSLLLSGEAVMFNPNKRSLTLHEVDLDVAVNGDEVGQIMDTSEVEMPAKGTFRLPISLKVPAKVVMGSLFSAIFSASKKQEIEVAYKGFVRLKALGIKFKLPVNSRNKVTLPL